MSNVASYHDCYLLRRIILSLILLLIYSAVNAENFSKLPAPYLGLKAPIDGAEVFAPGIVSTSDREIMTGALNGGRRLIFERIPVKPKEGRTAAVYIMDLIDGKWTGPDASEFPVADWYKNFFGYGIDKNMVIARVRLKITANDPFLLDLWSVRQTEMGWSEPRKLAINSDKIDTWPSVTRDGTIYFFSARAGGFGGHDLYRSEKTDGAYIKVENLGPVINTAGDELDPLIAPDEDFLIFCSEALDGFGDQDLFVSFKLANDSWSGPQNLGASINTSGEDMRPVLSADGKVLFFTSDVSGVLNIHWVDMSFVDRFRPKNEMQ